ncbi:hypothetical protein [Halostella salina]|uniref:hypothetical protein n=1 Tax=Halostella salina TaxID=1547897 RepID=UPI0013CEFD18|nr:hypothetical protein [Halostella salina]
MQAAATRRRSLIRPTNSTFHSPGNGQPRRKKVCKCGAVDDAPPEGRLSKEAALRHAHRLSDRFEEQGVVHDPHTLKRRVVMYKKVPWLTNCTDAIFRHATEVAVADARDVEPREIQKGENGDVLYDEEGDIVYAHHGVEDLLQVDPVTQRTLREQTWLKPILVDPRLNAATALSNIERALRVAEKEYKRGNEVRQTRMQVEELIEDLTSACGYDSQPSSVPTGDSLGTGSGTGTGVGSASGGD